MGGSAKWKEFFPGVSSSLKDDQTLLKLLTQVDPVESDKMSESAKAIKEGGRKKQYQFSALLAGQLELAHSFEQEH